MSDFDNLVIEMDRSLFDTFSEKAVYNNSVIIDVVIDQNVVRQNADGEIIKNAYEVTVLNEQIGKLSINNTVEIGAKKYTISSIVEGDNSLTTGAAYLG